MMKFSHIVIVFITFFASAGMAVSQTSSGTQEYGDGGAYEGEFLNGLPHGNGTYELPNGYRYVGEWFEGEINGQGEALFPNGSVYIGSFVKGKLRAVEKLLLLMVVLTRVSGRTVV